jgi:hypothetical protein
MAQETLVEEWKQAGKTFLAEFSRSFPPKAAFWLKEGEEGPWNLYIASEKIDQGNRDAAYTEVLRSARRVGFDPFRVRIVRTGDPIVKAALDVQPRRPMATGTYYNGIFPGISGFEGAYFYPPVNPISG